MAMCISAQPGNLKMEFFAFLGFLVVAAVGWAFILTCVSWVTDRREARAERREELRDSYYD